MPTSSRCPACLSHQATLYESVPAAALADAWSEFFAEAGDMIRRYAAAGEMPDPVQMWRCNSCTFEFADPQFAGPAEWYEVVERYLDRWEFSQTLSDLSRPSRLLEIGCGQGFFLERARSKGHTVVGLDFNADALEAAKAKGLKVHPWDLKELAQRLDTHFGAICLFHVIEHICDLDQFFADLNQVAAPSATLHFSCPGPRRFTTDLGMQPNPGKRDMWDYPPHHQSRFNQQSVSAMLSRLGWSLHKYVEEPLDVQGLATARVSGNLRKRGQTLDSRPGMERKTRIAAEMLKLSGVKNRYTGMSQYVMAMRT